MLFTFAQLSVILDIIRSAGLRIDIGSLTDFLMGKENMILLKAMLPIEEEESEDFYNSMKHNILANITDMMYMSVDRPVSEIEMYPGAGIFKEDDKWALYIPLEAA